FGGRELAEGSDLDLMLVYDAVDAAAGEFYARLTQRLISALQAPTEEGALYEIDTKLRPSGSQGPVAVRLSSFERYYAEEAWTWRMQAWTRARPADGEDELAARVMVVAHAAIARPRDGARTRAEVADMRARMERERPGRGAWDLKLAPGGFVDIEFIAQALQLIAGRADVIAANTGQALEKLMAANALSAETGALLLRAWRAWSDLSQLMRITVAGEFDPGAA